MIWTQSDTRYAVGTAIAAAIVVGVVSAGSGLFAPTTLQVALRDPFVPSILITAAVDSETSATLPAFEPSAPSTSAPVAGDPVQESPEVVAQINSPPTISVDPSPPIVIATSDAVAGTASDDDGTISKVSVVYTSGETHNVVAADVVCSDDNKQCRWSAQAPGAIGSYEAVAVAVDNLGGTTVSDSIEITIIAPLLLV